MRPAASAAPQHLAGEAFKLATAPRCHTCLTKGSAQAHLDLIAGSVQIMLDTTSSAMGPHQERQAEAAGGDFAAPLGGVAGRPDHDGAGLSGCRDDDLVRALRDWRNTA